VVKLPVSRVLKVAALASILAVVISSFLYFVIGNRSIVPVDDLSLHDQNTMKKKEFLNKYLKVQNGQDEKMVVRILGEPWERGERLDILEDAIESTARKLSPYDLYYLRYQPEEGEIYTFIFERQSKNCN
jgi:hypothetical protein